MDAIPVTFQYRYVELCSKFKILCITNSKQYAVSPLEADVIFAVDVATQERLKPQNYGNTFYPWKMMTRGNSGSTDPPSYLGIIDLLTSSLSSADLEITKTMPKCYYKHMPVEQYGLAEFDKFDKIFKIGFKVANK